MEETPELYLQCVKPENSPRKNRDLILSPTYSGLSDTLHMILQGISCITVRDLQKLIAWMHHQNVQVRWLSVECLSAFLKVSDDSKQFLKIKANISAHDDIQMGILFMFNVNAASMQVYHVNLQLSAFSEALLKNQLPDVLKEKSASIRKLKINLGCSSPQAQDFVLLRSHLKLLQKLFHLLSSGLRNSVCLYGPTGAGKSAMIQLIASMFARYEYPDVISVQMSDQIDSHLLLGSYHSTDIPGQFVWKPGCLTKAVISGHWIVIEDLDSAPIDVLTLLDSIIESQTLSVPGYGSISKFHPNFRLLSTCRITDFQHEHLAMGKISRHWKKIKLETIKASDLKVLLISLFPHLKTMADKLVTMLSVTEEELRKPGSKNRHLSLRDLLKLCRRVPESLDFTKPSAGIKVFQESLDVFVSSLHNPEIKRRVAVKLGGLLNILVPSTSFLLAGYKPIIRIDYHAQRFSIGRYNLPISSYSKQKSGLVPIFSLTKQACCLLERICGSVQFEEPILLIGETGVGKTSCIQFLARTLGQKLVVVNLNRQSDSSELLGGYKPVEMKYILGPIREDFDVLFGLTFKYDSNRRFLNHIMQCYSNRQWKLLVQLLTHTIKMVVSRPEKFVNRHEIFQQWTELNLKMSRINAQLENLEDSPFAFSFIEGALIDAIRNGYWILIDEINLATSEMLQCLSGILDSHAQIHVWERGNEEPIKRHRMFRFFAAMNPSTDVGKADLPIGLRNRFTEYVVDELKDPDELYILVADYLVEMSLTSEQIKSIVCFFITIKRKALTDLVDGTGKRPHFSLRTLCRALKIASLKLYGSVSRSLYESFCVSFLTQLNRPSRAVVNDLIHRYILASQNSKAILNQPIPRPLSSNCAFVEGYWISEGSLIKVQPNKYILTSSITQNLRDIARIVSAGKLPILIQGETSVGKTSLIQYLAMISGNRCYRINNHQHTDLQEYIGTYQPDTSGKLVFTEGILVQAMRKGDWIILDELNLAPSEVLEALNRLLDDNRQLFIAETGMTVTANPRFTLFATQNPPGLYGGRKMLSRAFRNRFVELHFDEIPGVELECILNLRCDIPITYCKKIIAVLKDLQIQRKSSAVLQGKHGFATLRDLFRWAERYRMSDLQTTKFYDWDQHLADEGFLVLAGKVRNDSEVNIILKILNKHFKRNVEPENLFSLHDKTSSTTRSILESILNCQQEEFKNIVWTLQMRRLAVLVFNAMKFKEPVLLVGETGGGKTTAVQIIANILERKLFSINCHMHSEGSDFLGGLRPRRREESEGAFFEWVDGALVKALQQGGIFLADEISLADDSVLERINSVLEPERTLLISEKGTEIPQAITAHNDFLFVGTMNPGGDFGKKELSPALRNRLTEIWCPVSTNQSDLIAIIERALDQTLKSQNLGEIMTKFCNWINDHALFRNFAASIRDYLAWANFVNLVVPQGKLTISLAIWHGACMVFLDGLGIHNDFAGNLEGIVTAKQEAFRTLSILLSDSSKSLFTLSTSDLILNCEITNTETLFGIDQFVIIKRKSYKPVSVHHEKTEFAVQAPTTCQNAVRILRAMQSSKPILLEGSPGVGKTALVKALAALTNNSVIRINMSEQTDISDLFGADLPVEGETGGHFAWRDGPLLQALKTGSWILLDEMNLASQSVLEGLNACLDHRGEIFVPELNCSFKVPVGFTRIFACQNPMKQGGARKGLPKSFLNRFTQVFIEPLVSGDIVFILNMTFPKFPQEIVLLMTHFSEMLHTDVCLKEEFGSKGSPWDFNLRDLIRWATLIQADALQHIDEFGESVFHPSLFVDLVYGLRMRTLEDRTKVLKLFSSVINFNQTATDNLDKTEDKNVFMSGESDLVILEDEIVCGIGRLNRNANNFTSLENCQYPTSAQLPAMEGLLACLQMKWMPILVGASGSGKSYLVRTVSSLCGAKLKILTPHPEMDTMELLGGFEQDDLYRHIAELKHHIEELMRKVARFTVLTCTARNELTDSLKTTNEWSEFFNQWSFLMQLDHLSPCSHSCFSETINRIRERTDLMRLCFLTSKTLLYKTCFYNCKYLQATAVNLVEECKQVAEELQSVYRHLSTGVRSGGFHWIHSILVKAIINGDWVLIDGANRCTSAVLDRLNSLLESSGSLFLTERGSIDGDIVELRPHPDFRLILSMNPCHGEISRAMRNRGVEIFVLGMHDTVANSFGSHGFHEDWSIKSPQLSSSSASFLSSSWCRVFKSLQIFKVMSKDMCENSIFQFRQINRISQNYNPDFGKTVLLTVFSRAISTDRELLSHSISKICPELSDLCSSLARKLPFKRDIQWESHFTNRFKYADIFNSQLVLFCTTLAKGSLKDYSYLFCCKKEFLPGTLGYTCKQAADGDFSIQDLPQKHLELMSASWSVFLILESLITDLVNEDDETNFKILHSSQHDVTLQSNLMLHDFGDFWLKGIKVMLCLDKMNKLYSCLYQAKNNSETMFTRLKVFLSCVEEDIINLCTSVGSLDSQALKFMETSNSIRCFLRDDKNPDLLNAEKLLREVCFVAVPLDVSENKEKLTLLPDFLRSVFNIWCNKSCISRENWPTMLKSNEASLLHSKICSSLSNALNKFEFQEEEQNLNDIDQFEKIVRELQTTQSTDTDLNQKSVKESQLNLCGLAELLYILKKSPGSTVFTHPWLAVLRRNKHPEKLDSFESFLDWEEKKRFISTFTDFRLGSVETSCLLPYFTSRIVMDGDVGIKHSRGATLKTKSEVKEIFTELLNILSSQATTEEFKFNSNYFLSDILKNFKSYLGFVRKSLKGNIAHEVGEVLNRIEELEKLSITDNKSKQMIIGQLLITAAGILLQVMNELPLVDPSFTKMVQVENLEQNVEWLHSWQLSQRMYQTSVTGKKTPHLNHPFFTSSLTYVEETQKLLLELTDKKAKRPCVPQYDSILKDLKLFVQSFGSRIRLQKMCNDLNLKFSMHEESSATSNELLTNCENWLLGHSNFTANLANQFWYLDIVAPSLYVSSWASTGVILMTDAINQKFGRPSERVLLSIEALVKFPVDPSFTLPINFLRSELSLSTRFTKGLFVAGLMTLANQVEIKGALDKKTTSQWLAISQSAAQAWVEQEDIISQKKEEREAFYVFKGKERILDCPEDDHEDVPNNFPNFESDFIGLTEEDLSSSGSCQLNETIFWDAFDVGRFVEIHSRLSCFVSSQWLECKCQDADKSVDFVTPFLYRFQAGCVSIEKMCNSLGQDDTKKFIVGSSFALNKLCEPSSHPFYFSVNPNIYDIYRDPCPIEVENLELVLGQLRCSVTNLLLQWPEHPSLNKVIAVINRLESFAVDSPLMKFLHGLELLYETAQEWERNAHTGVSLSVILVKVSDLILSWRKMELSGWKNLLEIEYGRKQQDAYKWWFHLITATMEVATSAEVSTLQLEELLQTLEQFIETSPLCQFNTRMHMLYQIHLFLIALENNNVPGTQPSKIHGIFWNVIKFYEEFRSTVASSYSKLKLPIEKKITDFVKICRWNDVTFYAVKDSIRRSQKMLSKFLREFKSVLSIPVKSLLVSDFSIPSFKNVELMGDNQVKWFLVDTEITDIECNGIIKDASENYLKMKEMASKFVRWEIIQLNNTLIDYNDVMECTVESIRDMETLEVEQIGPKRKAYLHHVHSRRRLALAELFKTLSQLDLSYRRGLVRYQNMQLQLKPEGNAATKKNISSVFFNYFRDPHDLAAGWKQLAQIHQDQLFRHSDEFVIHLWSSGTESDFQKCLTRVLTFMDAYECPSKQISSAITDRCKGFTFDLMDKILMDKFLIGSFSNSIWLLRSLRATEMTTSNAHSLEKIYEAIFTKTISLEFEFMQWKLFVNTLSTNQDLKVELTAFIDHLLKQCKEVKTLAGSYRRSVCPYKVLRNCLEILTNVVEVFHKSALFYSNSVVCDCIRVSITNLDMFVMEFNSVLKVRNQIYPTVDPFWRRSNESVSEKMSSLITQVTSIFHHLNQKYSEYSNKLQLQELISDLKPNTLIKEVKIILSEFANVWSQELSQVWGTVTELLDQYLIICQFYLVNLLKIHRGRCQLLSTLCCLFTVLGRKGFCLPQDYDEEVIKEGSELDSKGGLGLGDGEITEEAMDVSDRIESEDQLEDTLKSGQPSDAANKDIEEAGDGIEMPEDFDEKLQDLNNQSDQDAENNSGVDDNNIEEQMGAVNDPLKEPGGGEVLGGSSDEEDNNLPQDQTVHGKQNTNSGQEFGGDDNVPADEQSDDQPVSENPLQHRNDDDQEADDNQGDKYYDNCPAEIESDNLNLPEDLNLDDNGDAGDNDDSDTENPFDLDNEGVVESCNKDSLEKEDSNSIENEICNLEDTACEKDSETDNPDICNPFKELDVSENNVDFSQDFDNGENKQADDADDNCVLNDSANTSNTTEEVKSDDMGVQDSSGINSEKRESNPCESVQDSERTEAGGLGNTDPSEEQQGGSVGLDGNKAALLDHNACDTEMNGTSSQKDQNDSMRTQDTTRSNETKRLKTLQSHAAADAADELNDAEKSQPDTDNYYDLYQHTSDGEKYEDITTQDASLQEAKHQSDNCTTSSLKKERISFDVDNIVVEPQIVEMLRSEFVAQLEPVESKFRRSNPINKNMDDEHAPENLLGDVVSSSNISRPNQSSYFSKIELLAADNSANLKKFENTSELLGKVPTRSNSGEPCFPIETLSHWHELENSTFPLAQELCEQLRLILEPTISSRLRGDYKTGKRLNMRKIIPYIASGYRKDKIWLRRTLPSKRDYQILLALDDSASMSDNHSKMMAFSAVAVVSKSLSLLEAGQLSVVSFGEEVKLVHPFDEPFTDVSGATILDGFTFTQRQTNIAQLMKYTAETFINQKKMRVVSSSVSDLAQLLIVISDGRNVYSEGKHLVADSIRKAIDANIFLVFIVVDNPSNKVSILDIRYAQFDDEQNLKHFDNYLDNFPFPFYIVLRELNCLPSVMSDALRQWFELVALSERQ